jgi:hypothetical protein
MKFHILRLQFENKLQYKVCVYNGIPGFRVRIQTGLYFYTASTVGY